MSSRYEELLQKILNDEDVAAYEPQSRTEAYLKACALCKCEGLPEPQSRSDALLMALAEKMSAGGGGSGGGGESGDDEKWIDDGKTHFYITLDTDGRKDMKIYFQPASTDAPITVDWGDGSAPETKTISRGSATSMTHTYQELGDYIITVDSTVNNIQLGESTGSMYNAFGYMYNGSLKYCAECKPVKRIEISSRFYNMSAFRNCYSLSSVKFANSSRGVEDFAFQNCYSLSNIILPEGLPSVGTNAFENCSGLKTINLPKGLTTIKSSAFKGCQGLTNINIPESVTSIGLGAFTNCVGLTNINLPKGLTKINSSTFDNCQGLTNISIPEGVTSIAGFSSCYSLTNINIPSSVTEISGHAFKNCYSLANISIPEGVTKIYWNTFYNCASLENISIPSSVTSIDQEAFYNCCNMKYYDFSKHTSVPSLLATSAFKNIPNNCEIRVPSALYDQWKTATNWSTYASKIVAV